MCVVKHQLDFTNPLDFLKVKHPGLGLPQCLGLLCSAFGDCLFFWAFIYFSECFLLLLIPVGSQRVNVILVMLGRQYDRRRFCRVFWRQSQRAINLLWGCGCSIPAAGNSWLPTPLPLQHWHPPRPKGQQLAQQFTGQISFCSIGETDLVVVVMFRIKTYFWIADGWELSVCVCVCVFGGGWNRALTCSYTSKTREAARGQRNC